MSSLHILKPYKLSQTAFWLNSTAQHYFCHIIRWQFVYSQFVIFTSMYFITKKGTTTYLFCYSIICSTFWRFWISHLILGS